MGLGAGVGNSAIERVGGHFPKGMQGFQHHSKQCRAEFNTKEDCLLPPANRSPTLRDKGAPVENLVACSPGLLGLPLELPVLWAGSGAMVVVIPALVDSSAFCWTHPGSRFSAPGLTFPLLAFLLHLSASLSPMGKKNPGFGVTFL